MLFNSKCFNTVREKCYVDKYEKQILKIGEKWFNKVNKLLKKAAKKGVKSIEVELPYPLHSGRYLNDVKVVIVEAGYRFKQLTATKYRVSIR